MTVTTDGGWRTAVVDALSFTDPGGVADAPASAANADPGWLDTVNAVIDWVPNQVWVALLVLLFVGSVVTLPIARRQARKAGARTAGHTSDSDRRDRALFIAAMVPAVGTWATVLIGSFRGLVAFGRDTLGWHDGWEYLVPFTLDGVAVTFGVLAFRAIRKRRSPDRANRIVWGAATASAVINFSHEYGVTGQLTGGGYLALLSLFGMVIFHEFLDQFTEGTEYIRRENPAFKLRWLTWPTNTACAWVAWRNYPVAEGTAATVAAAVVHLDEVRATKREARQVRVAEGLPPAAWWAPVVPWVRLRQVDAAFAVQRAEREAERAEWTTRINGLVAEARSSAEAVEQSRLQAVHLAEQLATVQAERAETQQRCGEMERAKQAAEAALHRAKADADARSEQDERTERSSAPRPKQVKQVAASNSPKMTDDEAVQAMCRAHRSASYEWSKREVHRITGAGFGRIDRLIVAIAEHHRSTPQCDCAEQSGGGDDDAKEQSA